MDETPLNLALATRSRENQTLAKPYKFTRLPFRFPFCDLIFAGAKFA